MSAHSLPKYEPHLLEMRIRYTKDRSIIPTYNGCCTNACNILTKEINRINNNLEQMEFAGKEFMEKAPQLPRYQGLAYRTFALEEYRSKLTKKGICECIK